MLFILATAAKDATEALSMLKAEYFNLVIAELKLPDIDGLQLMRQIYSQFKLPVIREFVYKLHMTHGGPIKGPIESYRY